MTEATALCLAVALSRRCGESGGDAVDSRKRRGTALGKQGLLRGRAIPNAYFSALRSDPTRARLLLADTEGFSPDLLTRIRAAECTFAELIMRADASSGSEGAGGLRLQQLGAVAGVARISSIWIEPGLASSIDEAVDAGLALFSGLLP